MLAFIFLALSVSFAGGPASDPQVVEFLNNTDSLTLAHPTKPGILNHYYKTKTANPVALVFVPGMGEPAIKYYELAKDFKNESVTFYLWDHVGQGESTHLTPQDTEKIHIDDFSTHINALENFLKELKKTHSRIYVVAHSMGGHVTLRVAQAHPGLIDKIVVSSPMVAMNLDKMPVRFLRWVFGLLPPTMYIPFYYFVKSDGAKSENLTHSQERFAIYKKLEKEFSEIKRTSGTVGWVLAALKSEDEFKKTDFSSFTQKILVLQAEKEIFVSNKAQDEFCKKLPHCRLEVLSGAYHELLFEDDFARKPALDLIRGEFFTSP